MSDLYKQVNGKKVRLCKYECGTSVSWDDTNKYFIEVDNNNVQHTRERCQELKNQNSVPNNGNGNDISVQILLKKLSSIGIEINLEKLRNTVNGNGK